MRWDNTFELFNIFVLDERLVPQEGQNAGISRTGQNEVLVHGEDGVDQTTAVEYDRSSSTKSTSTVSRAGKAGEVLYSSVTRQSPLNQVRSECRQTDAAVSERSIYDHAPEHCYANVEKDESGRLLNRDTLAFRTSDFETEKSATLSNNHDGAPIDTSTLRADPCCDVPVVIHRSHRGADGICSNSCTHNSAVDGTHATTNAAEHVPYHTGRSIFYQRVDSTEGTSCRA